MSAAHPNFRAADRMGEWLDDDNEDALEWLVDYRKAHPRKFAATVRWYCGENRPGLIERINNATHRIDWSAWK